MIVLVKYFVYCQVLMVDLNGALCSIEEENRNLNRVSLRTAFLFSFS